MSIIKIENGVFEDDETAEYSQVTTEAYDRRLSVSGIQYKNLPDIITLNVSVDEAPVADTRQALVEILAWIDSLPSS